ATHPSPDRLTQIHASMTLARQTGQRCIPQVYCNQAGETFSGDGKRLWELTQWMPGRADYHQFASTPRLAAALQQLASLHRVWERSATAAAGPSPTLAQRCQRLQDCLAALPRLRSQSDWRSALFPILSPALNSLASDTLKLLA